MKNLIKNSILFFFVSMILYVIVFLLFNIIKFKNVPLIYLTSDYFQWKGGKTYQSFKEFNKEKQYDVIVVGSSHARTSIDPRIFDHYGYSVFNLSTQMQSLMNTYYIINNYITSKNCKLLIFDILELPLCSDGFESSSDLIQNITSDKAAAEMAFALKDIRGINMLTLRFINYDKNAMYYDTTYTEKGFCERTDSVKTKLDYTEIPFIPNKMQISYFEKTLKLLKERNIKTVLIDAPVPPAYKMQHHNKFLEIVKPLAEKYNVTFIDYSTALSLDVNNHFYDNIHINQAGVEIFDTILINDLIEHNLIDKEDFSYVCILKKHIGVAYKVL